MTRRSAKVGVIVALGVLAGVVARSQAADPPPGAVTFLEPKADVLVIKRTLAVVVRVAAKSKVTGAKLAVSKPGSGRVRPETKTKTVALEKGEDGDYHAKVETPNAGDLTLEAQVELEGGRSEKASVTVKVERSYVNSALWAAGTKAPSATGKTTAGADVTIDGTKPTLVHFYSAWDDCELEVKWLAGLAKKYPKLRVVGVASVTKADYAKWDALLKKLDATWENVPDPDGAIAKEWGDVNHVTPGSQTAGPISYVMADGKIWGGDFVSWDYVGKLEQCDCERALANVFKKK